MSARFDTRQFQNRNLSLWAWVYVSLRKVKSVGAPQRLEEADILKARSLALRALIGLVCFVILVGVVFVFAFVHQVQTKQSFRVTVSKFGAFPIPLFDTSWRVVVEQLSYEKLKNVEILIDQGTVYNSRKLFYNHFMHNSTIDGRAQREWGTSHQPSNITIVWDGGSETFLFNHYPFEDT